MKPEIILSHPTLIPYVRNIVVFENSVEESHTSLPFYADGCPGIMYQQTSGGIRVKGNPKPLSEFFLYGQTVHPIKLEMAGSYRLIMFCLYPHITKTLFGINPTEITDDCFNLASFAKSESHDSVHNLKMMPSLTEQIHSISKFLINLVKESKEQPDGAIQKAIQCILEARGKVVIKAVRDRVNMSERTFERQFSNHVGISPKLFARIIQFQSSFSQLHEDAHLRLTDAVYENGFADQSHFIRTFKKFTGTTPASFRRKSG